MGMIPITFSKGLNLKADPLSLKEGELAACEGFSYRHDGYMECRPALTAVNSTAISSIHTLYRYINWLLCGDGFNLRYKWDLNGYCNRYVPPDGDFTLLTTMQNANRLRIVGSDLFCFIVNGQDKKAFTNAAIYAWHIPNPDLAPVGAAGAGGNPNGTYSLYYTWMVKFPNGYVYETGPSPAGSVTVTSTAIAWGGIVPCPYTGTGIVKHRKLYRYSVTLDEYYLVTTIEDNTTTTYTDDLSDATLQTNSSLTTTDYAPPPDGMADICEYLGRIFGIKGNMLYWSEPYIPFCFPAANSIQVSVEGEDLTALMPYSDQLMIASSRTWYRLQGSSTDTWAIRGTFAEVGALDPHTVKKTRYGIICRWQDGLYIFNGTISQPLTLDKIGTDYFTGIDWQTKFGAEWDGVRYSLMIPSLTTSDQDLYTKLLLHCDGADAATTFADSSLSNHTVTASGSAQIDTAQKKFGTGSLLSVAGSGNLSIADSDDWHFGGDPFTIDFWVRFADVTRSPEYLIDQVVLTDTNDLWVSHSGQNIHFYGTFGGIQLLSLTASALGIANDTWYHVAIIRGWDGLSNKFALCLNGVAYGTTVTNNIFPNFAAPLLIGRSFDGWIDELRISKGIARWTENFTPPSSAYSLNSYVADPALPENVLVTDFSTSPVRFFDDSINVYADHYHVPTGIRYLGHKDGYQYDESGSETIATTIQTGDEGGNEVLQQKQLEYLYYEIDTNGQDVTITVYADGTAHAATITLNTSAKTRGRKALAAITGYRFSLRITCADSQHLKIYEPWGLSYSPFGE